MFTNICHYSNVAQNEIKFYLSVNLSANDNLPLVKRSAKDINEDAALFKYHLHF